LAIAIRASRWAGFAVASTIRTALASPASSCENVLFPRTAAATARPSSFTPSQDPSVTFHARTAWWPVMKISELEKHGPV
jgi:hypothetical protein